MFPSLSVKILIALENGPVIGKSFSSVQVAPPSLLFLVKKCQSSLSSVVAEVVSLTACVRKSAPELLLVMGMDTEIVEAFSE